MTRKYARTPGRTRQGGWPLLLGGLILLLIWPAPPVAAQPTVPGGAQPAAPSRQLNFRHITFEQGLSSQSVGTIIQDKEGFMWFGTLNGLNRYDGYDLVVFRNDPTNPRSLSSN